MTENKPKEQAPKPFDYVNPKTKERYRIGGCILSQQPSGAPQFAASAKYMGAELPAAVDLREFMTPVENQQESSSCVGNALAAAYEFLIKKNTGKHVDVSRLFIYYNSRLKDGQREYNMMDSGTMISNAIEALAEYGCCKEDSFPFDGTNLNKMPPANCYEEAKRFRIKEGMQLNGSLAEMKACLAEGYPFVMGLQLFDSFHEAATNGGRVPMPNLDEGSKDGYQGGHALLAAGYSDRSGCFIVQNSWGEKWGEKGYCYVPYEYICDKQLCSNWHSIKTLTEDVGAFTNDGKQVQTNEQQFWQPNDPKDYYHSIWEDKSASTPPPMSYILWVDYEKPEIEPMTRHLGNDPRVHITFQSTFTEATEYILLNIEKIKSLPDSSVFQIICRGFYADEKKNAFDLLPFLTRHKLEYVPIVVITGGKRGVAGHFKEQAAATGILNWRNRIFVTDNHAELITKINNNLIKKLGSQNHS